MSWFKEYKSTLLSFVFGSWFVLCVLWALGIIKIGPGKAVEPPATETGDNDEESTTTTTTTNTKTGEIKTGDAFSIGKKVENLGGGNGLQAFSSDSNGNYRRAVIFDARMENYGRERSVVDDLSIQSKKLSDVVKENAVADDLKDELRKVRDTVTTKENVTGEEVRHVSKKVNNIVEIKPNGVSSMRVFPSLETPKNIVSEARSSGDRYVYQPVKSKLKSVEGDTRPGTPGVEPSRRLGLGYYSSYARAGDQKDKSVVAGEKKGFKDVVAPAMRTFSSNPGYSGYWDWDQGKGVEKAVANEMGSTGHTFDPAKSNLQSGIGKEDWVQRKKNWDQIKGQVLTTVQRICDLFDRLFTEELFPEAVIERHGDTDKIFVRSRPEGMCVRIDRYYEYVQASIMAELSLGKVGPMPWGKSLEMGFGAIQKNSIKLKKLLLEDCKKSGKTTFIVSPSGELKTADGESIKITLPWPRDRSTLYNHAMMLKSSK